MIKVQLYKTAVTKYARHFLYGQVNYKISVCSMGLIFSDFFSPEKSHLQNSRLSVIVLKKSRLILKFLVLHKPFSRTNWKVTNLIDLNIFGTAHHLS